MILVVFYHCLCGYSDMFISFYLTRIALKFKFTSLVIGG